MGNGKSPSLAGYAKKPLVILSLVAFVDQVDTNVLRGVLPLLKDDWNLNDLQLGALGFAFVFVNVIATIPAGWVADRYNRTRIVGWTLLSWSGLSALSAIAINYPTLFLARAALGIGQAVDDPSSTSLLTDYYPAKVRGRVFSAQQVSVFLGGGIGLALGGFVGAQLGWRWAFALVGMPGSLIAFLCFKLREPTRGESELEGHELGQGPVTPIDAEQSAARLSPREFLSEARRSLIEELKFIFSIRTMRYVLVGVGTLLFTVSGVGYWMAIYHERYSNMTLTQATGVTAVVFAFAGIIGTFWGGRLADKVFSAGPQGRIRLVATVIMICAAAFLASFMVPVIAVRIALQFLGVIAISSAFPALRASMMDVVPAENRGVSASAFALTSTVFGTALAPPLVGLLSDVTGSLVAAFYIVTPPVFVGSLILLRAQHTIANDVQAIVTSMIERQQREAAEREAAAATSTDELESSVD
ncbi:MAG TPA: MFS transporter [Acidimicrobiales bacterium]|nr:MFS transporter [Acidimicrobiales bacterium]